MWKAPPWLCYRQCPPQLLGLARQHTCAEPGPDPQPRGPALILTRYICSYCLVEFLQTKQSTCSPRTADGGMTDEVLPRGVACPHCASIGTGQPLRLLDSHNTEEARSYLDSPGTTADLIRSSSGDEATQSPLRVARLPPVRVRVRVS